MRVEERVDAFLLALSEIGHSPEGEGSPFRYDVTQAPALSAEYQCSELHPLTLPVALQVLSPGGKKH